MNALLYAPLLTQSLTMLSPCQLVSSVEMEGEVDSLLVESGFLIVGLHAKQEGIIRVWNLTTSASHNLTGHKVCSGLPSGLKCCILCTWYNCRMPYCSV